MNNECRRPWWILHWPSWLTFVAVGGVVFLANVIPSVSEDKIVYIQRNKYGCPWEYVITSFTYSDIQWVFSMDHIKWWSSHRLFMDIAVGAIVIIGAVAQVEKICVRLRLRWTISTTFALTGAAGILIATTMALPQWVWNEGAILRLLITPIWMLAVGVAGYWLVSSVLLLIGRVSTIREMRR